MTRRRLTQRQKQAIIDRQDGDCFLCETPLSGPVEFDHVQALGLCGEDDLENICAVHARPCHLNKTRDDRGRIAKADRQRRAHEEGRGRKPKGPKIKGPGFKGWRKFNGEMVWK